MYEISWAVIVRKLTSRKFWLAVAAFVTNLIVFQGGTTETAEKVTALIIAGATVVAYIIGEGLADSAPSYTDVYIDNPNSNNVEEYAE